MTFAFVRNFLEAVFQPLISEFSIRLALITIATPPTRASAPERTATAWPAELVYGTFSQQETAALLATIRNIGKADLQATITKGGYSCLPITPLNDTVPIGLLVTSSPTCVSDTEPFFEASRRLIGPLQAFLVQQQAVNWHRQATSALAKVTIHRLRKLAPPPKLAARTTEATLSRLDNAERAIAYIPLQRWSGAMQKSAVRVCKRFIQVLRTGMQLDRCGLLLPSRENSGFWFMITEKGFPVAYTGSRNYVLPGQGLSGMTLQSMGPLSVDDVEAHSSYRSTGRRIQFREPDEKGPMAFLGVPVISQISSSEQRNIGAMVCCRFRGDSLQKDGFTAQEIAHIVNISSILSWFIDSLYWTDARAKSRRVLEALTNIWISSRDLSRKWTDGLSAIGSSFGLSRLLVALVTSKRDEILGEDAVGFERGIVAETRRKLYTVSPSNKADEDILSYVCREGLNRPIVVDVNRRNDPLSVHVNRFTAARFGISNSLVICPLLGSDRNVLGCILAELPSPYVAPAKRELKDLQHAVNIMARLFEGNRRFTALMRSRRRALELSDAIAQSHTATGVPQEALRAMLSFLSTLKSYDCAAVYSSDEAGQLIRCECDFGTDEQMPFPSYLKLNHVPRVRRSGDINDTRDDRHRRLLARLAARAAKSEQHTATAVLPPGGTSPYGDATGVRWLCLHLRFGNQPYGCIFLRGERNSTRRETDDDLSLRVVSRLCAYALVLARRSKEASRTFSELSGINAIVRALPEVVANAEWQHSVEEMLDANQGVHSDVVRFIADLFSADMAALWVPQQVIHAGDIDGSSSISIPIENARGVPFVLRHAHNYPLEHVGDVRHAYDMEKKSLTSAVIRTMGTIVSDDVDGDDRASHRYAAEAERACAGKKCRAYLGVPLVYQQPGSSVRYLYGVLSLTRGRLDAYDERSFSSRERALAEGIAGLLALGMDVDLRMVRERVYSVVRYYRHHLHGPLDAAFSILTDLQTQQNAQVGAEGLRLIKSHLSYFNGITSSYADFANGRVRWNASRDERVLMSVVAAEVFDVFGTKHVGVEKMNECSSDEVVGVDGAGVRFVVAMLVDNAFKFVERQMIAEQSGRRQSFTSSHFVRVRSCLEDARLVIEVEDTGEGMDDKRKRVAAGEARPRFSHQESTGLGLAVVREYLRAANGKMECIRTSLGQGTLFRVTIPLVDVG